MNSLLNFCTTGNYEIYVSEVCRFYAKSFDLRAAVEVTSDWGRRTTGIVEVVKKFSRSTTFIIGLFVSHDLTSKSYRIYEKFPNNAKELKKFLNLITISKNTMTRLGAQASKRAGTNGAKFA